ncbi:unnamed protein product [Pylaiella littoralis]
MPALFYALLLDEPLSLMRCIQILTDDGADHSDHVGGKAVGERGPRGTRARCQSGSGLQKNTSPG